MKKLLILSFLLLTLNSLCQVDSTRNNKSQKGINWDRFYVGGSPGLRFGDVTIVNITTMVGYNFSERFSVGITPKYIFFKDNRFTPEFKTDMYGSGIFARQNLTENLFAHGEYELINLRTIQSSRTDVHMLFLGGGYQSNGLYIMGLYDFFDDPNSPYGQPLGIPLILRVGFNFGL